MFREKDEAVRDKRISRREFLHRAGLTAGAVLLTPRLSWAEESAFQPFTFAHMADSHLGHHRGGDETLRRAIDGVEALRPRPRFVLITGDLTESRDRQYEQLKEIVARTKVPVRFVAGNHDVGNDLSNRSTALVERYRRHLGRDFYSFTVGKTGAQTLCIVLNSLFLRPWSKDVSPESRKKLQPQVEQQWTFLETELKRSADAKDPMTSVLLAFHHFLYSSRPNERGGGYGPVAPESRDRILSLCEQFKVQAVLTGHSHTSMLFDHKRTTLITTPSVSWNNPQRKNEKLPLGYRVIRVKADGIEHRYKTIDTTGWKLYFPGKVPQPGGNGDYVAALDGRALKPRTSSPNAPVR